MDNRQAPDYEAFGRAVFEFLGERGWNTVTKREHLVHTLDAALTHGLLSKDMHRIELACQLRTTPTVLDGWMRDLALRKPMHPMPLERLLEWMALNNQTTEEDTERGLAVFAALDAGERLAVELSFSRLGVVPDYRLNRSLLVINLSALLMAAARLSGVQPHEILRTVAGRMKNLNLALADAKTPVQRLVPHALKALREISGALLPGAGPLAEFTMELVKVLSVGTSQAKSERLKHEQDV
jgi:hypothetical protein